MVEHLVIFKFAPETSNDQKTEAIQRLKQLKEKIPGILDLQAGFNFCERSQGFELGLSVRFEDKAALETYGPHPEHQQVVSFLREIGLTDIIVVDFEI